MNVNVNDGAVDAVLTHAILVYSGRQAYSSDMNPVFASMHQVANVGTKAKPNTQILPGTPISRDGLMMALGSLADEYLYDTDLLPETLLGHSPKHMLWWRPAGRARVFFRNAELGKRSAVVSHPALVFMVAGSEWSVYALKDSVRPTMDTDLCHAPYFNVYDSGKICIGSAAIPDKLTPSTISTWESAFLESEFTHVNGHIKKVSHPRGEYAFWKEMLDGKYETFPTEYLVGTGQKLSHLLKALRTMKEA